MTSRPGAKTGRALRRWWLAAALVLGAVLAPAPARAQTRADSAAILLDAAIRLEHAGRREGARALLAQIRERFPNTPAAAEAAVRLAALPVGTPGGPSVPGGERTVPGAERSGKTELIVWGTLYGLWLGAAIPAAAGADKPGPYGAGLILGGPAGYAAARTYAENVEPTEGQARAITFGGTWGTWHGLALAYILDLGRDRCSADVPPGECFASNDPSAKAIFTSMIVGGVAGIGTGAYLADQLPISAGTATTVNLASLWGAVYGTGLAVLFGADDRHPVLTSALIGGDAALAAAALTSPHWSLSRERARMISITGVAGLLIGVGADLLLRSDSRTVNVAIPMATSLAGLAAGASWTRNMDAERMGGGGGGGSALLELDGGALRLGTPAPMPALLRRDDGRSPELGVYVPVVRASF